MPRQCSICGHPQLHAINRALVAGGSFRDIAGQFGVSKSAVERHQAEHLPKVLTAAKAQEDVAHALDVVKQLKAINAVSMTILREARDAKEGDLALRAIDRIHRQIELQAKLLGDLDDRPQVNVLVTPEWLALRGRILAALAPFPAARLALVEALDDAG